MNTSMMQQAAQIRSQAYTLTDALRRAKGGPRGLRGEVERQWHLEKARKAGRLESRVGYGEVDPLVARKWNRKERIGRTWIRRADFGSRNLDGATFDVEDRRPREAALVSARGWVHYSSRSRARYLDIRVLVIWDVDNQRYISLRVPPAMSTVAEALKFLKPAEVRRAEAAGKAVRRQGDFWFVPARRENLDALRWTNHHIMHGEGGVGIIHDQHGLLELAGPHRAVPVRVIHIPGQAGGRD